MAAVKLYELLKELGCPALEGVFLRKPEDIQRLLCTPSPHRLDILEWVCISVYPPFRDQMASLGESQTEMKIKSMAKLGADLTLCRADDLHLIEGKASTEKQLHFLEELVAVIPTLRSLKASASGSLSSTASSQKDHFLAMARKNDEFLKQVFCSPELQAVLSPKLPPWSSDIKPLLLDEEAVQKREKTLLEVSKELEETAAVLQDLRAQCSFLHGNPAGAAQPLDNATVLQALTLAASDFGQLLVAFEQVYQSELRKYCERPVPPLSPCGPLFKALQRDLSLCVQELKSLAQITETSENIVKTVERQQEERIPWRGSAKATLPSKLKDLHEKYKVIDALLHELSV